MTTTAMMKLAAALVALACLAGASPLPGGSLDPREIPKYALALPRPYAVRGANLTIALSQGEVRMLPAPFPETTVWAFFDSQGRAVPAVEARKGTPTRVTWRNLLVDASGKYLSSLLPVDTTIHWALKHRVPSGSEYRGPIPVVVHLHGAVVGARDDGHPDAWWMPEAADLPPDLPRQGPRHTGNSFVYPNEQDATALWFHDHTLGLLRLSSYSLVFGFYLVRDAVEDSLNLPSGDYELPLGIQDHSFNKGGSLFYPSSVRFTGYKGGTAPGTKGAPPPVWNPEFFGNTISVNGAVWPFATVEQRRYRLRVLNACNDRFLELSFEGLPFWLIGTDQGFRSERALRMTSIALGPAERVDIVFDFAQLEVGTSVHLRNTGADGPQGPQHVHDPPADNSTTFHVMRFDVVASQGHDTSTPPEKLVLPTIAPLETSVAPLSLFMNENEYEEQPVNMSITTLAHPRLTWNDPIPAELFMPLNEVRQWCFEDTSPDAHPMHVHMIRFQVVGRQDVNSTVMRPPLPEERGCFKDTVKSYPGQRTHIIAKFGPFSGDQEFPYVLHCSMKSHDDGDLMQNWGTR